MRRALAILASFALLAPRALLAAPPDCSDTTDPLGCRLGEFLSWLHFAAVILALALLAVIVIAVRVVRRNRTSADPLSRKDRR